MLWTPNEKSEFNKIFYWFGDKIDGVMTDKPTTLREWIDDYIGFKENLGKYLVSFKLGNDEIQEEEMTIFIH